MSAFVIYESMLGNTREIAEAVAEGLSMHLHTAVCEVATAPHQISICLAETRVKRQQHWG